MTNDINLYETIEIFPETLQTVMERQHPSHCQAAER